MTDKLLENVDKKLKVLIKSRKQTLFDGDALAITSNNEDGVFDILPHHANFITMIKDFVVVKTQNEDQKFEVKRGVLEVSGNNVSLYLTVI
ncbi:hypothetical protein A3B57_01655 [Microgenomates group bacterium RIFCSPLOWO2_01_FULL_47_10]|nr:MAG: hypothetical protein A3B57_01655 [Microgenomates group bacterium RIFCSPLOWO2_01_FULL_47_10]